MKLTVGGTAMGVLGTRRPGNQIVNLKARNGGSKMNSKKVPSADVGRNGHTHPTFIDGTETNLTDAQLKWWSKFGFVRCAKCWHLVHGESFCEQCGAKL